MPILSHGDLPTSINTPKTSIATRVKGDSEPRPAYSHRSPHQVDPNMGMVVTMRTLARLETFFGRSRSGVARGGLALLLTVSALSIRRQTLGQE